MSENYTFGELLRQFLARAEMSYKELGEKLGAHLGAHPVHRNTIGAWVRGDRYPETRGKILALASVLFLGEEEKNRLLEAAKGRMAAEPQEATIPAMGVHIPIWDVPYHKNPYFTGREDILQHLRRTLVPGGTAALTQPQAISGLGGIGKTQTAIEFTYRFQSDYQTIFWLRADSRETLFSEFANLAHPLNLPEKNGRNQNSIIAAVKLWLKIHRGWLLVLDNIEDLHLIEEFLPPGHQGSVLLTTRAHVTEPIAQSSELGTMTKQEGVEFLLHRTKFVDLNAPLDDASEYDRIKAEEIWEAMAGLPLALDQAAAYILETGCGMANYLDLYQKRRGELLKLRGKHPSGHPESVKTTLSLSFQRIERKNKAAADLLRLCAFLSPDAIPEEVFVKGAEHIGPSLGPVVADPLAFNETIRDLLTYSLVRRNDTDQILSMHRLAQAVIIDEMSEDIQLQWAERAVQVINLCYPREEAAPWHTSQQYLPHVLACTGSANHWKSDTAEVAQLLNKAATYLRNSGQFKEAEAYFHRALTIREQVLGASHPETAQSLNSLAILYREQGWYEEAEQLYLRALAIREQTLGSEHIDTAISLNNVAIIYRDQGKYEEAEPLFLRSLAIKDRVPEASDPHTRKANSLNQLAILYRLQGRYEKAESLFLRALDLREQAVGANHQYTAQSLNDLAALYSDQGRYEEAEPLFLRALTIREQVLKGEHRHIAQSLNGLARLYRSQGRYEEAEALFQRAWAMYERVLGINHPHTASAIYDLISIYLPQGKREEAERLHRYALDLYELQVEPANPATIEVWEKIDQLLRGT